jgi:putative exosortase-associated protein (TIGR04073 family)
MRKAICAVVITAFFVSFTAAGFCQDAMRKLTRGVANVITCPIEIPQSIVGSYNKEKTASESILFGVPTGILRMVARCGAGLYETVTFPFPVPENYCPVMEPEFILDQR